MNVLQFGPLVFGPKAMKPIVGIPDDARVLLRIREFDYARLYLKTADRTEQWLLRDEGEHWVLACRQAANVRGRALRPLVTNHQPSS